MVNLILLFLILFFYSKIKDNNKQFCITSEIYIKFLQTFGTLYRNKIEEISVKKERYQQGSKKLNYTANQVSIFLFKPLYSSIFKFLYNLFQF